MKNNDQLTPEGTRDVLFEECAAKRTISERVTGLFESYGYSEVITPGLEFYDVFNGKVRYFPQEAMYKLVDGKNRLMVLRPDSTLPIARLAATRLRQEELPLKLFYNQNIYMVNPKDSGRDDEIAQSGIEIIGGERDATDCEALVLAAKTLAACDENFRLEIGDSGIFRELISQYDSDSGEIENIRHMIEIKDYPGLENSDAPVALKALPRLFGGMEVFNVAKKYLGGKALDKKLARLKKLCEELSEVIPAEKLRVDLGLVHKNDYYTGLIFRGYVEGYGLPALSGGRYDTLLGDFGREAAAVGFAVNVEAAAKVFLKKNKDCLVRSPDVLVYGERGSELAALKHCGELIEQGMAVFNFNGESAEQARGYAKSHKIPRIDIISGGNVMTEEV